MIGYQGRCWLLVLGFAAMVASGDATRPDVLLITVDTLHASAPAVDVFDPNAARHQEMVARLESYKARLLAAYPQASEARERELDAEDAAELLRQLGYVE